MASYITSIISYIIIYNYIYNIYTYIYTYISSLNHHFLYPAFPHVSILRVGHRLTRLTRLRVGRIIELRPLRQPLRGRYGAVDLGWLMSWRFMVYVSLCVLDLLKNIVIIYHFKILYTVNIFISLVNPPFGESTRMVVFPMERKSSENSSSN